MTTNVQMVTKYGKNYDGSPLAYKAEISERYYNSKTTGQKFLLRQDKNSNGAITELFRINEDGTKTLLNDKLNHDRVIIRKSYPRFWKDAQTISWIPKYGAGEFYFQNIFKAPNGQKTVKEFLGGYMHEGKVFSLRTFDLKEIYSQFNTYRGLGGGGNRIFQQSLKVLKGLITRRF